jgi:HEAT repeat protein
MPDKAQQPGDSQFHGEDASSDSKTLSQAFISNILAHLGLGNRYLPGTTSLSLLRSELHSPDWRVRAAVARKLGKLEDQVSLAPLATLLADDASFEVKAAAARALGELAGFAPVEPLLAALDDLSDEVKVAAAWALGELGEHVPTAAPLVNLLNSPDAAVRATALSALGELGARTSRHILTAALEDPDWEVREMASLALERRRTIVSRDEHESLSGGDS